MLSFSPVSNGRYQEIAYIILVKHALNHLEPSAVCMPVCATYTNTDTGSVPLRLPSANQGEFILRGLARMQHLPFVAIMAVGGKCACFRLYKSGLQPLPLHPPSPKIV